MNLHSPFIFFPVLVISNIIAYVLNIMISKVWNRINNYQEAINIEEMKASILILFLNKIHTKHHEHSEKFNSVSLYYMSPWESLLFGILLTLLACSFHFNLYGFIFFLVFNWFYGVISHLNTKNEALSFLIFTSSRYHQKHHQLNMKNFGFYTFLWDKLFGTAYKKQ